MLRVSNMAANLIGSEIIKLAGEINALIQQGQKIYNLTIGDFDPAVFPIPAELTAAIAQAYQQGHTNYPPADGMLVLRQAVAQFLAKYQGLSYPTNDILIAGGARPLIYALYQTLLDPQDTVLFPVPSWNNNHYTHLANAQSIFIETRPEDNFMPTAAELKPHLGQATLLALCSPLNPTGTVFSREALVEISDMVLAENKSREAQGRKPLYILYDQIYWTLTFGQTQHFDPVSLFPELRPYTIFIDGLSKAFAATGVRIGWAFGPGEVIAKMKSILGHVGAWAPKAEQVATAQYLQQEQAVSAFLSEFKTALHNRLQGIYEGIEALRAEGFPVQAIAPQAAIYLTAQFNLLGRRTPQGKVLSSTPEITAYLLHEAKLAIVPFSAFGASADSTWYRISVGTCRMEDIPALLGALRTALAALS